ncbi:CCA tRNA nucleotidyltransferase [Erythrobacter sp. Alg231-14]|uniref:CCA tRNA nucleotidyltransferase n=1 Tax=Erythrobacter sp. Alg231-14 TaxID=1922225 RepID=UPI000D5541F1
MRAITAALGVDSIRWVGGAVRDTLIGMPVHDVDCATLHTPDIVVELCKKAGIRTVPTGIEHGTVTAILDDGPVEVTTLRRDVSTDGRRATVAFADRWEDDAARRDFTINALYAHPETLEISDYFGGIDDLKARRLRFIGDARQRIAEDHLRILRYYRFQARFGTDLDAEAEEACADLASTLKGLSRERIASEMIGILSLPNPHDTVARMREAGVLGVILPECRAPHVKALAQLIGHETDQGFAAEPLRRLAALLPPSPDVSGSVAVRLRLSRAQRARLTCAAERLTDQAGTAQALAYRIGVDFAVDRLLLLGEEARTIADWEPPQFPIKGGEIVKRGVQAGPDVARILRAVERRWVAEGFPDKSRVDAILAEEMP